MADLGVIAKGANDGRLAMNRVLDLEAQVQKLKAEHEEMRRQLIERDKKVDKYLNALDVALAVLTKRVEQEIGRP